MVRTQIQLTEKQAKSLRQIALREGVSMAEVIRRALDKAVEYHYLPDRDELKKRAMAAAGSVHSDITDLSSRHDQYLEEIYSE
ncbi:MAG: ribbon-helix-helix protein, CopG family [Armatimonadota bacterium]